MLIFLHMSEGFGERNPSFEKAEGNKDKKSSLLKGFQEGVELITGEEVEQVRGSRFGFAFGEEVVEGTRKYEAEFNIAIVGEDPSFEIKLHDKLIHGLSEEEAAAFKKEEEVISGQRHDVYVYRHGASLKKARAEAEETEGEVEGYTVEDYQYVMDEKITLRQYELRKDQLINIEQLAVEIRGKRVVFYTGAAMSEKGGVLGMTKLEERLGIKDKKNWQEAIRHLVRNADDIGRTWSEFSKAMAENGPTEAHRALTKIAKKTNSAVMTENIDLLHERAGTQAVHASGPYLRENVSHAELREIDAVVTVGLGDDDRGFLVWYKRHNPKGKIIAINMTKPPYISKGDFLVRGDLHKIVPQLEQELNDEEKP